MRQGWWKSISLCAALFPGLGFASPEFPAPRFSENSLELQNSAITISYNRSHKQPDWVFYPLGPERLRACVERSNSFRPDPRLAPADSAQLADYSNSGFDRGHMSPAGDNRWSQPAMKESFFLSNISPQPPSFNSGIWARLEGLVRAWATGIDELWVTTGPLLTGSLRTIGDSRVSVPEYFYKVLATKSGQKHSAIALLLPSSAHNELSTYAMSVDQLEAITGIDFLSGLEGEDETEAKLNIRQWDFHATFQYLPCTAVKPGPMDWAWGLSR
jgi:endonuclease G